MECRRPTSRDLNAALSAMQFQISPLKMEAAGVNRSANSAEYTRWNGYLWRKAAVHGSRPRYIGKDESTSQCRMGLPCTRASWSP
jgi:hypothetical protein